jgi:hypothetical protein
MFISPRPATKAGDRRQEITSMNGLKKGLFLESGKHGLSAAFQAVGWGRWPLFCSVHLVVIGLTYSVTAQSVSTNVDAAVSRAVSSRDTISVLAPANPANEQLPGKSQVLANKIDSEASELKPVPNLSIGVAIVGGLALFLWVQRLRRYSV